MGFPKRGMYFDDSRKRALRMSKNLPEGENKRRLIDSVVNQAGLHEGEGARKELQNELTRTTRSFSGSGAKQLGYGEGKKLGTGKWTYEKGKWQRV